MKKSLRNLNFAPIGSRIFALCLTLLLSVVISRTLSPDSTGVFFYAVTVFYLCSTVGRFGLDNYILKLGRTKKEDSIVIDSSKISIITTLLTSLICLFFVTFFNLGFEGIDKQILAWGSISLIPFAALVIVAAYLRTLGKLNSGIMLELGLPPLISIGLYSFISSIWGPTLNAAFASFLVSIWISSIAAVITLKVMTQNISIGSSEMIWRKPDLNIIPTKALLLTMFSSVMLYCLTWAPILIIGYVGVNASEVAYLFIAMRISALVSIIPALQTSSFGPAIGKSIRAKDLQAINLICRSNVNTAAIFAFFLTISICSTSFLVIPLVYGNNFQPAISLTIILTAGNFLVVLFGQVVLISQLTNLLTYLNITLMIICLSWFFFGPTISSIYGAQGIAWEMFLTGLVLSLTLSVHLWRNRKIYSFINVKTQRR